MENLSPNLRLLETRCQGLPTKPGGLPGLSPIFIKSLKDSLLRSSPQAVKFVATEGEERAMIPHHFKPYTIPFLIYALKMAKLGCIAYISS